MTVQFLLVGLGGAVGCMLRYLITLITARFHTGHLPLATFITNVLGCLLIGLLMGHLTRYHSNDLHLRLLLITGLCGGFTTFSAFSSENLALLQSGHHLTALGYMAASIALGLLATVAGLYMARA
jgi:fluoride exporter